MYGVYSDNCEFSGRKVEGVEPGYDYSLFFDISSSSEQIVTISVDPNVTIVRDSNFFVETGLTSFEMPFFIKQNCKADRVIFEFKDDFGNIIHKYEIPILKRFNPQMNIASQKDILFKLTNLLNYSSTKTLITGITANSGMGKTFILKQLSRDFAYKNEILICTFKNNLAENMLTLSRLFFGLFLGKVWDLDSDAINRLIKGRYDNLKDLLSLLHGYINKDKEIVVAQVIDTFRNLIINYKNYPFNLQVDDRIIILMDDCQKITEDIADILLFILDTLNESTRVNAILFSRKNECDYKSKKIYNLFTEELVPIESGGISSKDVIRSIKENFNVPSFINEESEFNLSISNVIHLENFLELLENKKNEININDPMSFMQLLHDVLNKNIESGLLRFTQKRDTYAKLLSIIYTYEIGIEQSWLTSYYGNEINAYLERLYIEKLIKLDGSKIYPYHDLMLDIYQRNCKPLQNEYKKFISYLINMSYISETEGLFLLIKCIDNYIDDYLPLIISKRNKLYFAANYGEAISICKVLNSYYDKRNMKNREYNLNRFMHADSLKYTSSYAESNKILIELNKSRELDSDVKYLIKTEILNNFIWMVDLTSANKMMEKMKSLSEYDISAIKSNKYLTSAYLNYYNRKMFLAFMLNDGEQESQLKTNLEKCKELERKDYEGFALMDYAKGIYLLDRQKAKSHLEEARAIFSKITSCKRRELDCLSDIIFLNGLEGSCSFMELYHIAQTMKSNKYLQSFFKTRLKAALLNLVQGTDDVNSIGDEVLSLQLMYPDLNTSKRMKMIFCHVLALVEYLKGDIDLSRKYSMEHYKIAKLFDAPSYNNIPKHNLKVQSVKQIVLGEPTINDGFAIDYRIW